MAMKTTSGKLTFKVLNFVFKIILNVAFYVFIAFMIINVSKLVYDFTYQLYGPVTVDAKPGTDITLKIDKGDATMDVANKLENNVAIVNKYAFYVKAKLQDAVIMPGTYEINNSMTYDEILKKITDFANSTTKEDGTPKKSSDGEKNSKNSQ